MARHTDVVEVVHEGVAAKANVMAVDQGAGQDRLVYLTGSQYGAEEPVFPDEPILLGRIDKHTGRATRSLWRYLSSYDEVNPAVTFGSTLSRVLHDAGLDYASKMHLDHQRQEA